ncbi:BolA family protein [Janthinobacterium sp. 17J80-10]|uniref:BolA family protein n=1 Tax=Janthinobacterium sp. 17J80-10 TaxID=2497863 RepID=UPI001005611B|nr:BolA family protein [Janthinobacterium sp. 17J80-10]QAU34420.1 BolA family transcriptional regulator [Janthinobacterium sp. 17J80-10]
MSPREERILSLVKATFAPIECQLEDDSAKHAGHAGAASGAGHYRLRLVSSQFEGQNRINRHRLVYDCLRDLMHADIHALNIIALAPSELQKQTPSV